MEIEYSAHGSGRETAYIVSLMFISLIFGNMYIKTVFTYVFYLPEEEKEKKQTIVLK